MMKAKTKQEKEKQENRKHEKENTRKNKAGRAKARKIDRCSITPVQRVPEQSWWLPRAVSVVCVLLARSPQPQAWRDRRTRQSKVVASCIVGELVLTAGCSVKLGGGGQCEREGGSSRKDGGCLEASHLSSIRNVEASVSDEWVVVRKRTNSRSRWKGRGFILGLRERLQFTVEEVIGNASDSIAETD